MDVTYALYSQKRKVLYLNDTPTTDFWSMYLQHKYPEDRWITMRADSVEYLTFLRSVSLARKVYLYDSTDVIGRRVMKEIWEAKTQLAKDQLTNLHETKDLFLVTLSVRGESTVKYMGDNIGLAFDMYHKTRGCDCVEVWRGGICVDTLYTPSEYRPSTGFQFCG